MSNYIKLALQYDLTIRMLNRLFSDFHIPSYTRTPPCSHFSEEVTISSFFNRKRCLNICFMKRINNYYMNDEMYHYILKFSFYYDYEGYVCEAGKKSDDPIDIEEFFKILENIIEEVKRFENLVKQINRV